MIQIPITRFCFTFLVVALGSCARGCDWNFQKRFNGRFNFTSLDNSVIFANCLFYNLSLLASNESSARLSGGALYISMLTGNATVTYSRFMNCIARSENELAMSEGGGLMIWALSIEVSHSCAICCEAVQGYFCLFRVVQDGSAELLQISILNCRSVEWKGWGPLYYSSLGHVCFRSLNFTDCWSAEEAGAFGFGSAPWMTDDMCELNCVGLIAWNTIDLNYEASARISRSNFVNLTNNRSFVSVAGQSRVWLWECCFKSTHVSPYFLIRHGSNISVGNCVFDEDPYLSNTSVLIIGSNAINLSLSTLAVDYHQSDCYELSPYYTWPFCPSIVFAATSAAETEALIQTAAVTSLVPPQSRVFTRSVSIVWSAQLNPSLFMSATNEFETARFEGTMRIMASASNWTEALIQTAAFASLVPPQSRVFPRSSAVVWSAQLNQSWSMNSTDEFETARFEGTMRIMASASNWTKALIQTPAFVQTPPFTRSLIPTFRLRKRFCVRAGLFAFVIPDLVSH
jgi:hypothetical protein